MVADNSSFTKSAFHEKSILSELRRAKIDALFVTRKGVLESLTESNTVKLVLLNIDPLGGPEYFRCLQFCVTLKLHVIVLVPPNKMANLDLDFDVGDFVLSPFHPDELVVRAKRLLNRGAPVKHGTLIRVGDLIINPTNYEVSLKGVPITLRFKEYELLTLMAASPGRVFSRESLLSQIWGYDYFGGTRTVDVHIRRLRSKLQDVDFPIIETIWKAGYRLRDPNPPE